MKHYKIKKIIRKKLSDLTEMALFFSLLFVILIVPLLAIIGLMRWIGNVYNLSLIITVTITVGIYLIYVLGFSEILSRIQ